MDFETEYLPALYSCRRCPYVEGKPVTGPVADADVLLVGQAPGPHEISQDRPFAHTAGRRLFEWFESIGWSEERFRHAVHICAVTRCFPGRTPDGKSDRLPSRREIENCAPWLDSEIEMLEPDLIILVGGLAIGQFLGKHKLKDVVGTRLPGERAGRKFDLIALPHPSGRSTWLNKPEHEKLLRSALNLIRTHPAMKR
ncbi:MAG: uracil-DNA glycosylase family protein [Thermoanaerobaculia bacterium]|nr:uracil-DNA glycosylase family protein [Thermoanaerobaculia bacterium]